MIDVEEIMMNVAKEIDAEVKALAKKFLNSRLAKLARCIDRLSRPLIVERKLLLPTTGINGWNYVEKLAKYVSTYINVVEDYVILKVTLWTTAEYETPIPLWKSEFYNRERVEFSICGMVRLGKEKNVEEHLELCDDAERFLVAVAFLSVNEATLRDAVIAEIQRRRELAKKIIVTAMKEDAETPADRVEALARF